MLAPTSRAGGENHEVVLGISPSSGHTLTGAERYPLLLQIVTAAPELREQRIATLVQRLRSHVPEE